MKFSVIIPTHYRDMLLQRALKSALRQTLPPHEILVVDDTCSKMTEACVEGISKDSSVKVIYIENKRPIGTSLASINQGAGIAAGDVLAILDDDDYWHKDYLKKVQDVMIREKADVVVTAKMNVDENGNLTIGKMPPEKYVKEEWLLRNPGCACSNFVVKKRCFLDVGGCDVRLKTSSDRDLFIRLMKAGLRYTVLKERLVYHSNYGNRLTIEMTKMLKSNLILYMKYFSEMNIVLHLRILRKLASLTYRAILQSKMICKYRLNKPVEVFKTIYTHFYSYRLPFLKVVSLSVLFSVVETCGIAMFLPLIRKFYFPKK